MKHLAAFLCVASLAGCTPPAPDVDESIDRRYLGEPTGNWSGVYEFTTPEGVKCLIYRSIDVAAMQCDFSLKGMM